MRGSSADERGSVRTWLKTGIDCWILAVTLPLRLYPMVSHFVTRIHATFSILTYIFEAVTKLAQLHKRLYDTSGFRHVPPESARNSCLDSSARYRAENPNASAQISMSSRTGYSRNLWKKVSYPCQVPYLLGSEIIFLLYFVLDILCVVMLGVL